MVEETTVAALIAISIGLVRIVEKLVEWGMKKVSPKESSEPKETVVHLDHETTRVLHDIQIKAHNMTEAMGVRDKDGTPMIYSSRSVGDDIERIAILMRDCTFAQQRLLDRLEQLDDKVEDIRTVVRSLRSRA